MKKEHQSGKNLFFVREGFFRAVIFFWLNFINFPEFVDTTDVLRYTRLKAEYLRGKLFLAKLIPQNGIKLKQEVLKLIEDFNKALANFREVGQKVIGYSPNDKVLDNYKGAKRNLCSFFIRIMLNLILFSYLR